MTSENTGGELSPKELSEWYIDRQLSGRKAAEEAEQADRVNFFDSDERHYPLYSNEAPERTGDHPMWRGE